MLQFYPTRPARTARRRSPTVLGLPGLRPQMRVPSMQAPPRVSIVGRMERDPVPDRSDPVPFSDQVGLVLRAYRRERGLSQRAFAEEVRVTQPTVARLERSAEMCARSARSAACWLRPVTRSASWTRTVRSSPAGASRIPRRATAPAVASLRTGTSGRSRPAD
ncbi:helix-turn-helix transcriptional regulator [Georgenia sp. H159]|uniref:helix-turn-helix transcriptional regulator n=1 Tax=Georgenia sp. H159 TaxID=3076115 RepID=UPI003A5CF12F